VHAIKMTEDSYGPRPTRDNLHHLVVMFGLRYHTETHPLDDS